MPMVRRIDAGCLLAIVLMAGGCGGDSAPKAAPVQQVYFDEELNRPVIGEPGLETPAVNPDTGHRTLVPALYCEKCQAWRKAPPLWVIERTPEAQRCTECGTRLASDGPLPTDLP